MEFNSEKHTWKSRKAANDHEKLPTFLYLLSTPPASCLLVVWSACSISILHSCLSSLIFRHGSPQNLQLLLASMLSVQHLVAPWTSHQVPFFRDWTVLLLKMTLKFKSPLVSPNHTEIAGNNMCKVWKAGWELQGSGLSPEIMPSLLLPPECRTFRHGISLHSSNLSFLNKWNCNYARLKSWWVGQRLKFYSLDMAMNGPLSSPES